MEKLKFLVTGTGRCGTVFMAHLLTGLGIPCGHESIFDYEEHNCLERLYHKDRRRLSNCSTHDIIHDNKRVPKWVTAEITEAESSYMICRYLYLEELANIPLIHVVREPLKVVSSFVLDLKYFEHTWTNDPWQKQIYQTLPELKEIPTQIERACLYYILWNERIESEHDKRPYLRHKVETIDRSPEFFDFIKKSPIENMFRNKEVNKFNYRDSNFTCDDIPNGQIKDRFISKIKEYGYQRKIML